MGKLIFLLLLFISNFVIGQNVGIRTTSPQAKLQINARSNSGLPILSLYDSLKSNGSYHLNFSKQGITNSWNIVGNTDNINSNANFRFYYAGQNILHLGATGLVGINTAGPQATLHVNSSNQIISSINGGNNMYVSIAENGQSNGYFGSFSGAATDVDFGTFSGNNHARLYLVTKDSARLMIDSTGWVGAGVLTPQNNLSINGGLVIDANNQNGIGGTNNLLRFGSFSGEAIGSNKNPAGPNYNGLDIYTAGFVRMSIAASGNVGVGTTNPQAKLHVAGSTKVNEFKNLRELTNGIITVGSSNNDVAYASLNLGFFPGAEDLLGNVFFRQLFVTALQENINASDAFAVQVQGYDSEFHTYSIKIVRVDANANGTGWGQNLKLHWMFIN